jgi:two-component system, NtrC family, sensor histidine kinase PilS
MSLFFILFFCILVGFVLAAIMGSHLAERARLTEVNYEELKQLHSTIVETSGKWSYDHYP